MKNYFEQICEKLNSKIKIENIQIVDNSCKHKHSHFHLKISLTFKNKFFIP